jgi:hypothetical protein
MTKAFVNADCLRWLRSVLVDKTYPNHVGVPVPVRRLIQLRDHQHHSWSETQMKWMEEAFSAQHWGENHAWDYIRRYFYQRASDRATFNPRNNYGQVMKAAIAQFRAKCTDDELKTWLVARDAYVEKGEFRTERYLSCFEAFSKAKEASRSRPSGPDESTDSETDAATPAEVLRSQLSSTETSPETSPPTPTTTIMPERVLERVQDHQLSASRQDANLKVRFSEYVTTEPATENLPASTQVPTPATDDTNGSQQCNHGASNRESASIHTSADPSYQRNSV